jgi:threonyl-tRNA synthetase
MDVSIRLSYRDANVEKFGGDVAYWEQAQREIKEVADEMGLKYAVAIGEASFYGPKIDFLVKDVIGRTWQLGTVQVDYVMPERFQLEYTASDGQKRRPVIIHRAPFGSMERFLGLLIEHYAGEFPLWLAPVQAVLLPITDQQLAYARKVYEDFSRAGIRVTLDDRNEKINYKIREWETRKIPYMLILGDREIQGDRVAVRQHKKGDLGAIPREEFLARMVREIKAKTLTQ